MRKICTKCLKTKQDTAFPIYIHPILRIPRGLYKECQSCCPKRILKRMDKYFSNSVM